MAEERLSSWGPPRSMLGLEPMEEALGPRNRAAVLEALIPHLPAALRSEVVRLAEEQLILTTRARLLETLAPVLNESQKEVALDWVTKAERHDENDERVGKRQILKALIPYLPPRLFSAALTQAQHWSDLDKVALLPTIAARMLTLEGDGSLVREALTKAMACDVRTMRQQALEELEPLLAAAVGHDRSTWSTVLITAATRTRGELCSDLTRLMPALAQTANPKALAMVARSVVMAGDWWP